MICTNCGKHELEKEPVYSCPGCHESFTGAIFARVIDEHTVELREELKRLGRRAEEDAEVIADLKADYETVRTRWFEVQEQRDAALADVEKMTKSRDEALQTYTEEIQLAIKVQAETEARLKLLQRRAKALVDAVVEDRACSAEVISRAMTLTTLI